jgi:hypothetical protein
MSNFTEVENGVLLKLSPELQARFNGAVLISRIKREDQNGRLLLCTREYHDNLKKIVLDLQDSSDEQKLTLQDIDETQVTNEGEVLISSDLWQFMGSGDRLDIIPSGDGVELELI